MKHGPSARISKLSDHAAELYRLLEEVGPQNLHMFHTPECGNPEPAECPLLRDELGCSQEEAYAAISELKRSALATFSFDGYKDNSWVWANPVVVRPIDTTETRSRTSAKKAQPKRERAPSRRLRFSVFARDGFSCTYCGRKPPEVQLVADHKTPFSKGGLTVLENLVTACFHCNAGKADVML